MATLRRVEKGPTGSWRHGHGPNSVTPTLRSSPARILIASVMIVVTLLSVRSASAQHRQTRPTSPARKANPTSTVAFADVTRASGIDFHLTCGGLEKRYIMESVCGGVAVFDYDNDGWMDIFLVDGSTLEDLRAGKCHRGKLYRNNHDGTFTDVTVKAGLSRCGWGFGVAGGGRDRRGRGEACVPHIT